jgi:m7GpppX diphosphatase
MDRSIKSLRDLNSSHLTLLENIQIQVNKIIPEKYSINPNQLILYVHYQPSYYHFHVHIANIKL